MAQKSSLKNTQSKEKTEPERLFSGRKDFKMSKAKYAVVWRESVYKSHRCPNCGTRLIDGYNQPIDVNETMLMGRTWLFCKTCGLHVAYIAPYNGPLKPGTMGGYWNGGKPV